MVTVHAHIHTRVIYNALCILYSLNSDWRIGSTLFLYTTAHKHYYIDDLYISVCYYTNQMHAVDVIFVTY